MALPAVTKKLMQPPHPGANRTVPADHHMANMPHTQVAPKSGGGAVGGGKKTIIAPAKAQQTKF